MSENQDPREEPTQEEETQEEPQEPIGGAGGHPHPSERQKFGKLPGLTVRQTYRFIIAIPTIQLGISFILFFVTWMNWYSFTYAFFSEITGASLTMCLYYWYMARLSGSCIGALLSVYTLAILNVLNVIHLITPVGYYTTYGVIITGVGFVWSLVLFKPFKTSN